VQKLTRDARRQRRRFNRGDGRTSRGHENRRGGILDCFDAVDAAVTQTHDAITAFDQILIVSHEHKRRAAFALQREHQIHDLGTGTTVQIARWFVGEENSRAGRNRARQRDSLLLAAGELAGIVIDAMREADRLQFFQGAVERICHHCQFKGYGNVFERRHRRDQMKRLKHDTDIAAAKASRGVLVEFRKLLAGNRYLARCRALEPCHHHQHRRLARAGRTHEADRLALGYLEIDSVQDIDGAGLTHKCEPHGLKPEQWF
jgi:hypothetical protein